MDSFKERMVWGWGAGKKGGWNQNGLLGLNILDLTTMRQYEITPLVHYSVQYCSPFTFSSTLQT